MSTVHIGHHKTGMGGRGNSTTDSLSCRRLESLGTDGITISTLKGESYAPYEAGYGILKRKKKIDASIQSVTHSRLRIHR